MQPDFFSLLCYLNKGAVTLLDDCTIYFLPFASIAGKKSYSISHSFKYRIHLSCLEVYLQLDMQIYKYNL